MSGDGRFSGLRSSRRRLVTAVGTLLGTSGCLRLTQRNQQSPSESATDGARTESSETTTADGSADDGSADDGSADASPGAWPLVRRDTANSGSVGWDAAISSPRERWRFETPGRTHAAPVVENRTVYVTSNEGLFAVSATDGSLRWKHETETKVVASPAVGDEAVVVVDRDGRVHCLNSATGDLRWRLELDESVLDAPTLADGRLFVSPYDSLHAIDLTNGEQLWTYETDQRHSASVPTPVVTDGHVFAIMSNEIYKFDAADGSREWTVPTVQAVHRALVYANKRLFVPLRDGKLLAVDTRTGRSYWERQVDIDYFDCSPVVVNQRLLLSGGGELFSASVETGERLRQYETPGEKNVPIVVGNAMYAANEDGSVQATSLDGERRWSVDVGCNGEVPLAATREGLYAVDSERDELVAIGEE